MGRASLQQTRESVEVARVTILKAIMPTARQLTVETPVRSFGLGSSDSASLRKVFASSPIVGSTPTYNTDAIVRLAFERPQELGSDGMLSDGGYAVGSVSRYYRDAPNLATVEVGGGGLPATPYSPNVASPGEGNGINYRAIPGDSATLEAVRRLRGGGGAGVGNGLESPSTTTQRIVPRRIGDTLQLGRSARTAT